jgi:hypothetical protein
MTKEQIDAVLDRVREWPVERQEDAVRMLLEMEQADTDEFELTEEQYARLDQAIAEADRGEFATGRTGSSGFCTLPAMIVRLQAGPPPNSTPFSPISPSIILEQRQGWSTASSIWLTAFRNFPTRGSS